MNSLVRTAADCGTFSSGVLVLVADDVLSA